MSFSLVFMTLKWLVSLYSFYKLVKCLKTKGSLTISRVVKAMFTEENEAQENKKEKFNISTAQTRQKMISQPSPIVRLEQQGKRRGPLQRREMFQANTQFFKNETANMSSQLNMPNLSQNQIFEMLNPSNYEEVNDFDYPRRPRRINIPKIRRNGRKTSHFTWRGCFMITVGSTIAVPKKSHKKWLSNRKSVTKMSDGSFQRKKISQFLRRNYKYPFDFIYNFSFFISFQM